MYHKVDDPSQSVKNFYTINDKLGEGTFGIVRRVNHKETGEDFAMKTIRKEQLDYDEVSNLHLEIEILSQVAHPNIVQTLEIYEEPNHIHIIMEIMEGGELFDKIVEKDHYSEKEAADTIRPIIDAIKYCHEMGIVHRDLKPENLLYTSSGPGGIIKISDFGLARFFDEDLMTTACGTPGYVAPEILEGRGYGLEVDFWSLGVIIYIMLCGFPPFYEESNEKLFDMIKKGEYDFPSPAWDSISEMAKDLIRNCLKVNPAERFGGDQILAHEWIAGEETPRRNMPQVTEKIREFNSRRKFRKFANTALASSKLNALIKNKSHSTRH
jgi:calcium/calmodulin-dependent protein kinase I